MVVGVRGVAWRLRMQRTWAKSSCACRQKLPWLPGTAMMARRARLPSSRTAWRSGPSFSSHGTPHGEGCWQGVGKVIRQRSPTGHIPGPVSIASWARMEVPARFPGGLTVFMSNDETGADPHKA